MQARSPFDPKWIAVTVAVALFALALYAATLAPTVLWGDDAEFQRVAITGEPLAGGRHYPLYLTAARLFARLPWGDVAWRVNLVSAVFATLAVSAAFVTAHRLTGSLSAAVAGSAALALSHTFWMHAVRAEVYSHFLFVFTFVVLLFISWRRHPREAILVLAMLLTGIGMLAHQMILTALPAIAWLVWRTPTRSPVRTIVLAVAALAVSLSLAMLVGQSTPGSGLSPTDLLTGIIRLRPAGVMLWIGYLGYQFLWWIPVGILGFVHLWRMDRVNALFLALLYVGSAGFGLIFHVSDRYVFFVPSYVVFALWVALGVAAVQERFRWKRRQYAVAYGILAALLIAHVGVYRLTPIALERAGVDLLGARELPFRDNNLYFLYPPKNGYRGAYLFGTTVLETLPPRAAVLADWSPMTTLLYFQAVEGLRPDVTVREIGSGQGEQVAWLLAQSEERPVFMADNGRYYDVDEIEQVFEIEPFGPIFRLARRE